MTLALGSRHICTTFGRDSDLAGATEIAESWVLKSFCDSPWSRQVSGAIIEWDIP